jgi:hypothetical protein
MSRSVGICVNCQEQDVELVAYGLCRTCYQREWRDKNEVPPDKFSKRERKRARKIRKAIAVLIDGFEDLEECGVLEGLETREVLRDLLVQLVAKMRMITGASLLERLERDLEPAPQGAREFDENKDEEKDDDDDDDGFVPS